MSEKIIEIGPCQSGDMLLERKISVFCSLGEKMYCDRALKQYFGGKISIEIIQKTCFKDVMSEKIIEIGPVSPEILYALERKISVFRCFGGKMY
jgi:hypothetical protein